MHYYFIDPFKRLIHRIDGRHGLSVMQGLVMGLIEAVRLSSTNEDIIYVNEEFGFSDYKFGFIIQNERHKSLLIKGYGIYIGTDDEGDEDTPDGLLVYANNIVDDVPYKKLSDFASLMASRNVYMRKHRLHITRITAWHVSDLDVKEEHSLVPVMPLPFKTIVPCDDVHTIIKEINERNHFNPDFEN